MPPFLATIFTVSFCIFLLSRFARDPRSTGGSSWLPVIWIFFVASRFPSQWLALFGLPNFGGSLEEGSPPDAVFFLCLILKGALDLKRRNFSLPALLRENFWLTL